MIISTPNICHENNEIIYKVDITFDNKERKNLWYKLPFAFNNLLSSSSDTALVALLLPAMQRGENIYIEGNISKKLFYNLSGPYQKLIQHVIPSLKFIEITAQNFSSNQDKGAGVATAFSGGIDSFSILSNHHYKEINTSFKTTHLLFNNVGSHGWSRSAESIFFKRFNRLSPITKKINLPFIYINSNIDTFYSEKLNFQQTHTLRNTSATLLLQKGISRFYYASGVNYTDIFVGETYDIDHIDSITLPMLSTENMELISSGSQYTRVEKTLQVSKIKDSYTTLDVCTNPKHTEPYTNCSTCQKCMRTLFTLELHKKLDLYNHSFNIDLYKKNRLYFIASLLKETDPLSKEIKEYAKTKKFNFSLKIHLLTYKYYTSKISKNIRSLYKKLVTTKH